jgi:hypothetical protein
MTSENQPKLQRRVSGFASDSSPHAAFSAPVSALTAKNCHPEASSAFQEMVPRDLLLPLLSFQRDCARVTIEGERACQYC